MAKLFKEFQIADDDTCKSNWSGYPHGKMFFCAFCGHKFKPGDEYRAIYTNDLQGAGGNPLTCRSCFDTHGEEKGLRVKWQEINNELRSEKFKFFWMRDFHTTQES